MSEFRPDSDFWTGEQDRIDAHMAAIAKYLGTEEMYEPVARWPRRDRRPRARIARRLGRIGDWFQEHDHRAVSLRLQHWAEKINPTPPHHYDHIHSATYVPKATA